MRKALAVFILTLSAFAAEQTPAKPLPNVADLPVVSPAAANLILKAERDILTVGRNMDKLVQDYKDLQSKQNDAQKAMQAGVDQAYKEIGDPDHKKYDLNVDTLVFTAKPAPPAPPPAAPAKK